MYSQSLDGSDRRALEALYAYLGREVQPGELLGQRIRADLPPDEQDPTHRQINRRLRRQHCRAARLMGCWPAAWWK